MRDVRRIGGGRGLREGPGKRVDGGVSWTTTPELSVSTPRPLDDCSPGRGGMAQDDGTRGGTFHVEMDRCTESQGWTTTCSSMSERDEKDQGEDSPKSKRARAGSLATVD